MGKHPKVSQASSVLPLSIFARLYDRLREYSGDVISLQIGDTICSPPQAAWLNAQEYEAVAANHYYAYSSPVGDSELTDLIVAKLQEQNGLDVSRVNTQITNGATHALSSAVRALLDPGDEMLLLSPHWPLILNIARSSCVVPIEVPFTLELLQNRGSAEALLASSVTEKTAAIYLSNPNNPDGAVYTKDMLAVIAEFARKHDLWVIADEVYEEFVHDGNHLSIASFAPERTITAFSFSKSYAMAGLRVGYVVGPDSAITSIRKMVNTSVYSVPLANQLVAKKALQHGRNFLDETREKYRQWRDQAFAAIRVPCFSPQAGTYLFLDLSQWCEDEACCMTLLEEFASQGVMLAPGEPFGKTYSKWARLCFTAEPIERVLEGIERIHRVLGI